MCFVSFFSFSLAQCRSITCHDATVLEGKQTYSDPDIALTLQIDELAQPDQRNDKESMIVNGVSGICNEDEV